MSKAKKIKLNKSTKEGAKEYAAAIRILLRGYKVPKAAWSSVFDDLDDWPKADADQDLHWYLGWFNGAAEALGCNLEDLVVL